MAMPVIYFAAPLFTQAEWLWNAQLAAGLRERGLEVILPQERSVPMLAGEEPLDGRLLFRENVAGIERADVVVAVWDQADPDSGTAWECGYAFRLGRPIVALRTDFRSAGDTTDSPVNLMLAASSNVILTLPLARRTDLAWVAEQLCQAIATLLC